MSTALIVGLLSVGSPPVLLLAGPDAAEARFVDALRFQLADADVSVMARPPGFTKWPVSTQAASQADFFGRAPRGLLVWTAGASPTVYVLTSGQAQPRLRVIEAHDWQEAQTAVVAVWRDTEARLRLGVEGRAAGSLPADRPAGATGARAGAPQRWRLHLASGAFSALAGSGDVTGYVAVRAVVRRRFDPIMISAGVEAWPVMIGVRGWGVGPLVKVGGGHPAVPWLSGAWTAALVVHRWSAPAGFNDPPAQVAVRTGPQLAADWRWAAGWDVGVRIDVGLWPLRSVFEADGVERSGIPVVDIGASLVVGHLF